MMHKTAKYRARKQGAEFKITVDDVREVWPADNRCPVLGTRLKPGSPADRDASPSLDRLHPGWGYVRGNIAVVSDRVNRIKSNGTAAEHESIAAWMRGKGLA